MTSTKDSAHPLIEAIARNDESSVRTLLSSGQDPNEFMADPGVSALLLAVFRNRTNIVKMLLEAGADPNKTGRGELGGSVYEVNPLFGAINGYLENQLEATKIAQVLLDKGADSSFRVNGQSLLRLALRNQAWSIASLFLSGGVKPKEPDEELLAVFVHGKLNEKSIRFTEDLSKLLDAYKKVGADFNFLMGPASPLSIAMVKRDVEFLRKLLDCGADPNLVLPMPIGMSALGISLIGEFRDLAMAELLLEFGADADAKQPRLKDLSYRGFAELSNDLEILKLLDKAKKFQPRHLHISSGSTGARNPVRPGAMLVGQESAKGELSEVISLVALNQKRKTAGLPEVKVALHCVFQGSPGTGKTTFARYYAEEIRKLGVLSKGHLIEASRQDLIGGFMGQTAMKTTELIAKALGGVLFIDEAYSLKNSREDSYGQEAIDTLLKLMEDHRSDLVVILAGYTKEMASFLDTNPGLRSRIPNMITFEDFDDDQLRTIFKNFCQEADLEVGENELNHVMKSILASKGSLSFANARTVRNAFEKAIKQQALRLSRQASTSKDDLRRLILSDFE